MSASILTRLAQLLLLLGIASCQRATYSFQSQPGQLVAAPAATSTYRSGHEDATTPAMTQALLSQPAKPGCTPRRTHRQASTRAHRPELGAVVPRLVVVRHSAHHAAAPATAAKAPAADLQPVRRRSRLVAALLAGLSLVYPFGIQYFYLGYTGRGLAVLGVLLLSLYLVAANGLLLSASAPLGPFGVMAIVTFAGLFGWQFYDFVRILNCTLQPKNGEYRQPPAT